MDVDADELIKQGTRCSGVIDFFECESDNLLTICQQTAWYEQEGFRLSIEKRFPSIKVYFMEELGCQVYYTNDPAGEFFPERFVLDDSSRGTVYFETIGEAIDHIGKEYGIEIREHSFKAVESAITEYSESHENEFIYFNEFNYCDC